MIGLKGGYNGWRNFFIFFLQEAEGSGVSSALPVYPPGVYAADSAPPGFVPRSYQDRRIR